MKSAKDKGTVRIFVYGSLKRDLSNHTLMQSIGAEFICYDTISGPFIMVSRGGFPSVHEDDSITGALEVYGELYSIPPHGGAIEALDLLEGHPRWYERKKYMTDRENKRAWMYVMQRDQIGTCEPVDCNMWRPTAQTLNWWKAHGTDLGLDPIRAA